jgi:nitrogen fixation protein FixH
MAGSLLQTPPPARGRSTRPSRMFPTWPKIYLPKSATADFGSRSAGGRDPRPIPSLFKGREETAARPEPHRNTRHLETDRCTGKRLTGRGVLLCMLAFFGVIIGVNLLLMKLAIDTMPGLEVDSSYRAGNVYNAEIAAARSQSARQWQVAGHLERGADGRTFLEVEARDPGGAPLTGLAFSAHLERPTDKRADRSVALVEQGLGIYRGQTESLAPGQWDLVLEADRGSARLFLSKNRVELR